MAHGRDKGWQDATIDGPEGGQIIVDVTALLFDAGTAMEMTIPYAHDHLQVDGEQFIHTGPGWYQYANHALLVAPCSRHSGAGDQHYLFLLFPGVAEGIQNAMAWAVTAPLQRIHAPPDGGADSGPVSGLRPVSNR